MEQISAIIKFNKEFPDLGISANSVLDVPIDIRYSTSTDEMIVWAEDEIENLFGSRLYVSQGDISILNLDSIVKETDEV